MQTFWYRRLLLKDSALLKSIEADATKDGSVRVGRLLHTQMYLNLLHACMHTCMLSFIGLLASFCTGESKTCRCRS
jgi:hypothetical protein